MFWQLKKLLKQLKVDLGKDIEINPDEMKYQNMYITLK